jgi:hypothetical protein
MLRLAVVFCIVSAAAAFLATPGSAQQINTRTLTLAAVNECVKDAIASNRIDDDGTVVAYSCTGARARTLFNFLGKKIRAEVVQDRNGKFENRAFGNNSACYHRVEDQNGNAADEFQCDLYMVIGDSLSE